MLKPAIACAMFLCLYGCDEREAQNSQATVPEQVQEEDIRRITTFHRDEWLKTRPAEDEPLDRSVITSVAKTSAGWHVTFTTRTGDPATEPDGIHDYVLHIWLDAGGKLVRIERGPDRVT